MENLTTQKNTGFYITLFILVYLLICALYTVSALDPQPDNAGQLLNWILVALLAVKISEAALVTIPLPKPNPRKGYLTFSIIVLLLIIAVYLSAQTEGMQNAVVFLTAAALFFQSIAALASSILKFPELKESPVPLPGPRKEEEVFQMADSSLPLPKPNTKK
ncbi:MAG TPA: hypothetical protein VHI78_07915 [Bacteroidales bacterium]|jgi:hypothetical protein|nr:hypothetical protein [Bacteroidales bacterium]